MFIYYNNLKIITKFCVEKIVKPKFRFFGTISDRKNEKQEIKKKKIKKEKENKRNKAKIYKTKDNIYTYI